MALTCLLAFASSGSSQALFPVCGSAERLPVRSASCDAAMANFMLHNLVVTRRLAALEEIRRLVRPGGTVVMANHSSRLAGNLREVHALSASACGYTASEQGYNTFTLDSLAEVQAVFPNTRVEVRETKVLITDLEAVLRYYASFIIDFVEDRPRSNSHREPMLRHAAKILSELIAVRGAFEDDISAGVFVSAVS